MRNAEAPDIIASGLKNKQTDKQGFIIQHKHNVTNTSDIVTDAQLLTINAICGYKTNIFAI